MTDREIQEKLLEYYKFHYEIVAGFPDEYVFDYLRHFNMIHGICYCAWQQFGLDLGNQNWIRKHFMTGTAYWAKTPFVNISKRTNLSRILTRIQILTKILNK